MGSRKIYEAPKVIYNEIFLCVNMYFHFAAITRISKSSLLKKEKTTWGWGEVMLHN